MAYPRKATVTRKTAETDIALTLALHGTGASKIDTGVPFFDLRDELDGIPGTYRLTDGHWTERGTEIVAARVARELAKLRPN